jgi:pimeloyl-ACP methyl ester carboxylesterase
VEGKAMATFVLLHGASSDGWYWHLVAPQLEAAGHDVVAPDLPLDDDEAGIAEYADAVVTAIGDRRDLVLVAQSMAGFTAPLVAERLPCTAIILVCAMVPRPGESPGQWWDNTGQPQAQDELARELGLPLGDFDPQVVFLHDVPVDVAAESAAHVVQQSSTPFVRPWPLTAWPQVPTHFLLCRGDRLFPAEFQRRVVKERLGSTPDEMDGGHLPALHSPDELSRRLLAYEAALQPALF